MPWKSRAAARLLPTGAVFSTMARAFLSRTVLVALLAAASTAAQPSAARDTVSINFGWRYAPDPDGPAHGGDAHGPAVNSTAPAVDAKQAQADFDDSSWAVIDIPHDASVTGDYASSENGGEGFLPLARTWYRKKIAAPESWASRTVTLVVDAALSTTTWYFNGKQLLVQNPVGYLPTILQLDVKLGAGNRQAHFPLSHSFPRAKLRGLCGEQRTY